MVAASALRLWHLSRPCQAAHGCLQGSRAAAHGDQRGPRRASMGLGLHSHSQVSPSRVTRSPRTKVLAPSLGVQAAHPTVIPAPQGAETALHQGPQRAPLPAARLHQEGGAGVFLLQTPEPVGISPLASSWETGQSTAVSSRLSLPTPSGQQSRAEVPTTGCTKPERLQSFTGCCPKATVFCTGGTPKGRLPGPGPFTRGSAASSPHGHPTLGWAAAPTPLCTVPNCSESHVFSCTRCPGRRGRTLPKTWGRGLHRQSHPALHPKDNCLLPAPNRRPQFHINRVFQIPLEDAKAMAL